MEQDKTRILQTSEDLTLDHTGEALKMLGMRKFHAKMYANASKTEKPFLWETIESLNEKIKLTLGL